ncbi:HK97-gp10 family putative phage morphogenesis protein [Staphylococcus cohnii]|uniref:HK97-gp10 family putative phage morphogenesis protein n=1 Tax=Staphylococcus ureilyticus TaxID=94138 RepID=UPI001867B1B3
MAGMDALIKQFRRMHDEIDDDVDEVLKENANEYASETVKNAKEVMNKGYWTGNLARQVKVSDSGHLSYDIVSNAHYSGFLEYGTRYMEPETFMFPAYQKFLPKVRADLKRRIDG